MLLPREDYDFFFMKREDLLKIMELRKWDLKEKRKLFLFFFCYFSALYTRDPAMALDEALDINSDFLEPLKENEVTYIVEVARKHFKDYTEDLELEEDIIFDSVLIDAIPSNETLVELLEISRKEEQEIDMYRLPNNNW